MNNHALNARMIRTALAGLGAVKTAARHGQEFWRLGAATVSFNGLADNTKNGSAACKGVYVALPRAPGFFVAAEDISTLDLVIAKRG